MKSASTGIVTSGAEVFFLDHKDFPWFQDAAVGAIWNVEQDAGGNLHWPQLDVDLELASLESLNQYPLIYK